MILWGSVSLSDEYFATVEMPVAISDLPNESAVAGISMETVSISVKGLGWQLAGLNLGPDLKFDVSARNRLGRQSVNLKNVANQNSWLTSSIQLMEIKPDEIEFRVEKLARKRVPVIPDLKLNYRPGYGLVSPLTVYPDSVTITGPGSVIAEIEGVNTSLNEMNDINRSVAVEVELAENNDISYENNIVKVEFEVQKIVDKVFENVPVEVKGVPQFRELKLYPEKVNITLRGGINLLGKMKAEELKPYVTFRQALSDTLGIIEPVLTPPDYTILLDVKPKKLEYIIKKY